jgi:hypothetical protein
MITATANWKTEAAKLVKSSPIILFEIAGYSRSFATQPPGFGTFDPWIATISRHRQSADELGGRSTLGDLNITVGDVGQGITGDFPFVFEGRTATIKVGFVGLAEADYALFATVVVDRVASVKKNTAWEFICKPKARNLRTMVYETGDDGQPTGKDHPKTLQAHPLDILTDVWQNELGLPLGELDTTTINAYRDQVFTNIEFAFTLSKPPEAKAFIEAQLLAPLGGFLYNQADGTLSVRFIMPLPGGITSLHTLNPDNMSTLPSPGQVELVNVVTHRMDWDGDDFLVSNVQIDAASETKYGQQGAHTIESLGLRTALGGVGLARVVAIAIFNRFGDKQLRLPRVTSMWDDAALLEVGDYVKVTHPLTPNRATGALGVTDELFVVRGLSRDWLRGRVDLALDDAAQVEAGAGVDPTGLGPFRVAPNATLEYVPAPQGDKDRYMFVSDDATGQYSNSDEGHPLA